MRGLGCWAGIGSVQRVTHRREIERSLGEREKRPFFEFHVLAHLFTPGGERAGIASTQALDQRAQRCVLCPGGRGRCSFAGRFEGGQQRRLFGDEVVDDVLIPSVQRTLDDLCLLCRRIRRCRDGLPRKHQRNVVLTGKRNQCVCAFHPAFGDGAGLPLTALKKDAYDRHLL